MCDLGVFQKKPATTQRIGWCFRLPRRFSAGAFDGIADAFTATVAAGSAWSGLRAGSHAEVIPPRSGRR
jgi:hypothetical protein